MRLDLAMGLKNMILKVEAAITKVDTLAITKINNFCQSRDAENENNSQNERNSLPKICSLRI